MFHADLLTNMTKIMVVFCNSAKAPKKLSRIRIFHSVCSVIVVTSSIVHIPELKVIFSDGEYLKIISGMWNKVN